MPLPNPGFEPENSPVAPPGGGAKSGGALPNLRSFGEKKVIFCPKKPATAGKMPQRSETVATLHVWLDFTMSRSRLVPFDSTICPRNSPKRRQKAPKSAQCAPTAGNQARAVSWATWLESEFRGHLVQPQPPTFCASQASELPNERLDPRTSGHLVQPEGSTTRAQSGPTLGTPGSPRRKKSFFQSCSQTTWDGQTSVLAHFETVVAPFGPWKIPKCLENGPFQAQKWVKMGQKRIFPKVILDHLACSNKCF